MLEEQSDCAQTITQMKAARSAFNSLIFKYLSEQTDRCFNRAESKDQKEKIKELIKELIK